MLADIGFADALLARRTEDGTLELIDGHLRAELTSRQEVPVLVLDLTEEEAERLLVSLDPLASMAETDKEALSELLQRITLDSEELLSHLQRDYLGLEVAPSPRVVPPDSLPEHAPARTRAGDLWVLGDHRLLCGDATKKEDVTRLMGRERAALCSTDPPYMVGYTGADRPFQGKDWSKLYREPDPAQAEAFYRSVFENALAVCRENVAIYLWLGHRHVGLIERIWSELGILNHQEIVWVKPTATATRSYWPWQHEPCLMGWRRKHKPPHDGRNTHTQTSVWELDYDGRARQVGNKHPTQKPVELFRRPIEKHTKEGEVCFEPFSGSGSQIVAAEMTGRRCFALEISPVFCDLAVSRWEEFTGGEATLERGRRAKGSNAKARKDPTGKEDYH